jgi:hypothetical protein
LSPPSSASNSDLIVTHTHLVSRANRLFARLADCGTQRDTAGNRKLLFSHYASLVLLSFFNPALQTLRGLQQASTLKSVQRRLGVGRTSLGSLSESSRVFDPELLVPLVQELLAEHDGGRHGPGPRRHIPEGIPPELVRKLLAVDGSTLRALPRMVTPVGKLHLQFQVLHGLPEQFQVLPHDAADERDVLRTALQAGRIYLADRGYERYALYNQIVAAQSDYVIRGQARAAEVIESRPLSSEAAGARILEDAVVRLNVGERRGATAVVDHPIRRLTIAKRDQGRARTDRPQNDDVVILYTNRLDVAAEVVAAMYEVRWSIELFFRFLKQMLGLRRLFAFQTEAGAIQVYCAMIAGLLMSQITGGRVTQTEFRLLQFYLQGWADEEELLAGLEKLRQQQTNTS